jgi:hypothetical protein
MDLSAPAQSRRRLCEARRAAETAAATQAVELLIDPARRIGESATLQRVMAQSKHPFAYVATRAAVWGVFVFASSVTLNLILTVLASRLRDGFLSNEPLSMNRGMVVDVLQWTMRFGNLLTALVAGLTLVRWEPENLRLLKFVWLLPLAGLFALMGVLAADNWISDYRHDAYPRLPILMVLIFQLVCSLISQIGPRLVHFGVFWVLWRGASVPDGAMTVPSTPVAPPAMESGILNYLPDSQINERRFAIRLLIGIVICLAASIFAIGLLMQANYMQAGRVVPPYPGIQPLQWRGLVWLAGTTLQACAVIAGMLAILRVKGRWLFLTIFLLIAWQLAQLTLDALWIASRTDSGLSSSSAIRAVIWAKLLVEPVTLLSIWMTFIYILSRKQIRESFEAG